MTAVRRELVDTSGVLKLALSGLKAIEEEVEALTAGVGGLSLSEAAARVSQGAERAVVMASRVLQAAEVAKAAAGKAAVVVAEANEAKAEAEKAAAAVAQAEAAVAEAETAVAQAEAVAAHKAELAAKAAAALEEKVPLPALVYHTQVQGGDGGIDNGQGAGSSPGVIVGDGHATVAIKTTPGEGERNREYRRRKRKDEQEGTAEGKGESQVMDWRVPVQKKEEEEAEEDEDWRQQQSRQEKRKLQDLLSKLPFRRSARVAGCRRPDYTESPTTEPSKRQRMGSVPAGRDAALTMMKEDTPAVSDDMKEKTEAEALKMLEFYFGNSNFCWDRFMQNKVGYMGENLMDVSILLTFNKLKNIVRDGGLSTEEGFALIARLGEASPHLRVSEDKQQIGRAEPLTEETRKMCLARTVQTLGYTENTSITIEGVEKLFAEIGKTRFVKICRRGNRKITSILVEFENEEQARRCIARSGKYKYGGITIKVRPAKGFHDFPTPTEVPARATQVVYEAGKVLHIVDIPDLGVSRENLKEAVKSFGTAVSVSYSSRGREAWIRMENASEAAAAVSAAEDGGLELAPAVEQKGTVSLLDGDDEKTYYERMENNKAGRNNRSNGSGHGNGRREKE